MGTTVTFSLVLVFTETAVPRGVQTTGGVMFVVDSTWNPAGAIGQVITASAFVWEMSSATLKNSNTSAYVSLLENFTSEFFSTCRSYRPGGSERRKMCSTLSTALVL